MANIDTELGLGAGVDASLTVLQSFPVPDPTSNPYVSQLADSLARQPGVHPVLFSWRAALMGRPQVFHVHWPEALIERRTWAKTQVRRALYLAFLLKLRLARVPIVRTLHNLERPRDVGPVVDALLRLTERWTTLRIVLNPATPVAGGRPSELILHGDYRGWFARYSRPAPVPGRIVFFGRIRRYKNVPALISAIRSIPDRTDLSLRVAGNPSGPELASDLRARSAGDDRIAIIAHHLDDADLVREVGEAELVVLPYAEMHNSGSVLAALSLDRPVLVPDNEVNRLLRDEVGAHWVRLYPGELRGGHLTATLDALRAEPDAPAPDLHRRDWDDSARAHVRAYRRAIELRRRPS